MKKSRVFLALVILCGCFIFSFIQYAAYLENQYVEKQLALIGRLSNVDEDILYKFFLPDSDEDIEKGKTLIQQQSYRNDALMSLHFPYRFSSYYFITFFIALMIVLYLYHRYLQSFYSKTYLYELECIINHHYQIKNSHDPIMIQLNQLNDYFIKLENENNATKKRMQMFIEDIAHQIKTPLTTLKIYTELSTDKKTQEKGGKQIERLEAILNELISLAKLEAHAVQFHFEKNSINECLEQVLEDCQSLIEQKELIIDMDITDYSFSFDFLWLSEAIINILKNAVEFSHQQGIITISNQIYDNKMILRIQDQGIGFSLAEGKHLFDRFYSSNNSLSRKNKGMGIGLNISYEVIKAHHGYIFASSNEKGALFTMELPLIVGKEKI